LTTNFAINPLIAIRMLALPAAIDAAYMSFPVA
jgi:hypothetical protein